MNRRNRRAANRDSDADPGPVPAESSESSESSELSGLSRRGFLRLSSLTTIAASGPGARDFWFEAAGATTRLSIAAVPSATFKFTRRNDMILMTVRVYNMQIARGPQRLVVSNAAQPAFITFELPPQHVLEGATTGGVPTGLTDTRLSGPSRLAFMLPPAMTSIALRPEVLLDWEHNGLVPSVKDPTSAAAISAQQTLIEAPWGLAMTPSDLPHTWRSSTTPVTRAGWTETWHARLAMNVNGTVVEPPVATPLMRALEAVGHIDASLDPVGTAPLTSGDRAAIISQSSTAGAQNAVGVEYLALSTLGATMRIQGDWPAPGTLVKQWRNHTAQGRDSFVRVVYGGFLMPWGFPVSFIKETQRSFATRGAGPVAYLYQRQYITVRKPTRSYPGPFAATSNQRWALPFRSARINTLRSPLLQSTKVALGASSAEAFWPTNFSGGADVLWSITAYDHDGQPVTFTTPLAYVAETNGATQVAYNPAKTAPLALAYTQAIASRRVVSFGGQRVALAPSTTADDTAFAVQAFAQGVVATTGTAAQYKAADEPAFVPVMASADVEVAAIRALSAGTTKTPQVKYEPTYAQHGFPAAAVASSEVFLAVISNAPKPQVPLDRAGGIVSPIYDVSGLSRRLGPVGGDLAKLVGAIPEFDPASYFASLGTALPKLFGEIPIIDLLPSVPIPSGGGATGAPNMTTRIDYPGTPPDRTKLPRGAVTTMRWAPKVRDVAGLLHFVGDVRSSFDLNAVVSTPLADSTYPNTYDVRGELRNFELNLLDSTNSFLILTFTRLRFAAHTGAKPTLSVDLAKVTFAGPLEFVNELKDFLASTGKGPRIDVQPSGVTVDYSVQLPNIGIGVFSLQNVALSTRFGLPFDGRPVFFEFAVCTSDRPFLMTMSLFGGGGYFKLVLTSQGIREVSAELNLAAALELNLGVASGGLHVSIGIGFRYVVADAAAGRPDDIIDLYGIVRAGGSLEVLGVITISVDFVLDLHYLPATNTAHGRAELTVSVDVLFFSTSVTLSCERTIGGGSAGGSGAGAGAGAGAQAIGGAATFVDNVPTKAIWDTYCDAFA